MATQEEWQERVNRAVHSTVTRGDVRVAARVGVDGDPPLDQFDEDEFAQWLTDWVEFSVASMSGPVMPSTAENEWTIGDDVRIDLLLQKNA